MDPSLARLHLEIELDSEPIAGAIGAAGGSAQRFRGWIELAELIERARRRAAVAGEILGPVPGGRRAEL